MVERWKREIKTLGVFGFLVSKIKKHGKAWWRWRWYTCVTVAKMVFIKWKMHRLIPLGSWATMSRWGWKHRDGAYWFDDIALDFNSINPKKTLWTHVCCLKELYDKPILYLEFGVYQGNSLGWWAKQNRDSDSYFWGFDSFDGLPERFAGFGHGFLQKEEIPKFDDSRVHLVVGLFQNTLDDTMSAIMLVPFYSPHNKHRPCMICHLDADAFSGTLYALMQLDRVLRPGDVLIFDEFAHIHDEFEAFNDFIRATGRRFKMLAASDVFYHVAFEVVS